MKSQKISLGLSIFLAGLLTIFWSSGQLKAQVLTVTNTNDSGAGSLRQVIADANSGDTINFDSLLKGESIMLTEQIIIDKDLIIDGGDLVRLDANNNSRHFSINNGTFILQRLELVNGTGELDCFVSADASYKCGGSIKISSGAEVEIVESTLKSNSAGDGGAIYNEGTVFVTESVLQDNNAVQFPGAGPYGGGIYNTGRAVIHSSTLDGNRAFWGGGIWSNNFVEITNSTVSNNVSLFVAGGVFNSAVLNVYSSTFSGNEATNGDGGGILNDDGASEAKVINSTFSKNYAGFHGGGIQNLGKLDLINSTLNMNTVRIIGSGGGIYNQNDGDILISNSIIANSEFGDCINVMGAVEFVGTNIVEDSNANCGLETNNVDPLFGALADNGCVTLHATPEGDQCVQTIEILLGSPAMGVGDTTICNEDPINNVDQRGFPRSDQNTPCDLGAYETQNEVPLLDEQTGCLSILNVADSDSNLEFYYRVYASNNQFETFDANVQGSGYALDCFDLGPTTELSLLAITVQQTGLPAGLELAAIACELDGVSVGTEVIEQEGESVNYIVNVPIRPYKETVCSFYNQGNALPSVSLTQTPTPTQDNTKLIPIARNDRFYGRIDKPMSRDVCDNDRFGDGFGGIEVVGETIDGFVLDGCSFVGAPVDCGKFLMEYRLRDIHGNTDIGKIILNVRRCRPA